MGIAKTTIRDAEHAKKHLGHKVFTEREYEAVPGYPRGYATHIDTLVKHNLVVVVQAKTHVIKTKTPDEFAQYVNDLMGEDLWGASEYWRWNPTKHVFQSLEFEPQYQFL